MARRRLHILGVCGTAMAAVATLARQLGWHITGSDAHVYPPMSDYLRNLGIPVQPYSAANLDQDVDLVVIGNALSRGNAEVEAVLARGLRYTSGAQFIGDHVLPGRHAVVVAGTHGKTTTSSLVAWLLERAGRSPGFMIGGLPNNFAAGARLGEGETFVLEGDEYDTAFFDKRSKFLHYHARTLILNNLEFDHADIFPDLEAIKQQFHFLLRTVPGNGRVVVNLDDAEIGDVLRRGCWSPVIGFARHGGRDAPWQWRPEHADGSAFRLYHQGKEAIRVRWPMLGVHHVANAAAAAAAVHALGLSYEEIARGLASFAGVKRRMSLVGEARGVRVFDDFAHHPTAIRGVVEAARVANGGRGRLWVVVEPRSNTMRTRVHQDALPASLEAADRVLIVPPAARGLSPDQLLDVARVCRRIGEHAHVCSDSHAVIEAICAEACAGDDVLILSNGGFDGIHQRLLDALDACTD